MKKGDVVVFPNLPLNVPDQIVTEAEDKSFIAVLKKLPQNNMPGDRWECVTILNRNNPAHHPGIKAMELFAHFDLQQHPFRPNHVQGPVRLSKTEIPHVHSAPNLKSNQYIKPK